MPGFLILLAAGLALYLAALVAQTAATLARPRRRTYAWAVARGVPGDPSELPDPRPFEMWSFDDAGRAFSVWDIPGDAPSGPVFVCTHGWGESRHAVLERLPALLPVASRVIAWDLPGHGDTGGLARLGASEAGHLLALVGRVRETAPPAPIVLFGWSLGAGVSIAAAAADAPVHGVVAEAPYRMPQTPARNLLRGLRLPWRINLPIALAGLGVCFGVGPRWRRFDRAALAARLTCPLLVLHGGRDEVCPLVDGRAIAGEAREGRLEVVEGGHHRDLWLDPRLAPRAREAVRAFVAGLARP